MQATAAMRYRRFHTRHDADAFAPDTENSVAARIYRQRMKQQGAADFDELLVQTAAVLQTPEAQTIARTQYTHLLVDEFQVSSRRPRTLAVRLRTCCVCLRL